MSATSAAALESASTGVPGVPPPRADPLVVPLAGLGRRSLAVAGGKAANLGELMQAGFPVPPGFCVTTGAYATVAETADLAPLLGALATTAATDTARLADLASAARERLLAATVADDIAAAIGHAYRSLASQRSGITSSSITPQPAARGADEPVDAAEPAVAVRSSATAEDLPGASFAGQQDTFLNVTGVDAVLDAVRRCWASLWTDRAVAYRARNGIDHRTVRLAVVVQLLVDAAVAGVLFTANPLTGRRRQIVVDASPGLGEAIVSGLVNPDHFVVDGATEAIVERRLGDKRIRVDTVAGGGTRRVEVAGDTAEPCLSDGQLRALARLGTRVERHFGAPQDIEWALTFAGRAGAESALAVDDAVQEGAPEGALWLTQARPITTLYPLPANAPADDRQPRVYFSFNVAQGVYRPFTPMGIQALRLIASAAAGLFGAPPRDPELGPPFAVEAGHRLFLDITPIVRSTTGRRLLGLALGQGEARTAPIIAALASDARLAPVPTPGWRTVAHLVRYFGPFLARTRLPLRVAQALKHPAAARLRAADAGARAVALGSVAPGARPDERLAAVVRLLVEGPRHVLGGVFPNLIAGLGAYALGTRLLRGAGAGAATATPDEQQAVLRGLPHNPTTEMDLELWALSRRVQSDTAAARALRDESLADLAAAFRSGTLPPVLQIELQPFLRRYGHRSVAEIDAGVPRWSDDPTPVLGAIANYLQLDDQARAPDVQFRRAAEQGEAMVVELAHRASRRSELRGRLVRFLLGRARSLAGLREAPKFHLVAMLAQVRTLLRPVGELLARSGGLDCADDIYFLTLAEARQGLAGSDLRALVSERRASFDRELQRRRVPRILLSDGTEPDAGDTPGTVPASLADAHVLLGAPASAGVVTAPARVIRDPHGARLAPGEILVAPSTDPGWTPLFLTAAGLVMEMGGPMSHGAVVAREYGIPAVVGVPNATDSIETGQRITVDGSRGTVTLSPRLVP